MTNRVDDPWGDEEAMRKVAEDKAQWRHDTPPSKFWAWVNFSTGILAAATLVSGLIMGSDTVFLVRASIVTAFLLPWGINSMRRYRRRARVGALWTSGN